MYKFIISYLFFLVVVGFEFRVFYLLGRHSDTGTTPPVLFALVIFQLRYSDFLLGWPGP
jgi:hypothetical protein